MSPSTVTVIIPAYNEAARIGSVIRTITDIYDYEVLVIDDCSTDDTAAIAAEHGASVITNEQNYGYLETLQRGLRAADGDILVTMDADGEHRPVDIEPLVAPIASGQKDLMFGKREGYPRPSERVFSWLVRLRVDVTDSGSGFRALRQELAEQLTLPGECTCGTLVLEAHEAGARIGEVPTPAGDTDKPRRTGWWHWKHLPYVLKSLL